MQALHQQITAELSKASSAKSLDAKNCFTLINNNTTFLINPSLPMAHPNIMLGRMFSYDMGDNYPNDRGDPNRPA